MSRCDLSHSDFETNCSKWVTGTALWSQPVDISEKQAKLEWRQEKLALRVRRSLSAKESTREEMRRAVPFLLLIGYSLRSAWKCVGSCVCVRCSALVLRCASHSSLPATLEQPSLEKELGVASQKHCETHNYPISSGWPTNFTFIYAQKSETLGELEKKLVHSYNNVKVMNLLMRSFVFSFPRMRSSTSRRQMYGPSWSSLSSWRRLRSRGKMTKNGSC